MSDIKDEEDEVKHDYTLSVNQTFNLDNSHSHIISESVNEHDSAEHSNARNSDTIEIPKPQVIRRKNLGIK